MKLPLYSAALIGTGRIGFTLGFDRRREQPASHTMALMHSPRIKLTAGCDSDPDALARWHRFVPGAQCFSSSRDLFSTVHPDIVTIAVNEQSHAAECFSALAARPRLVILEKPVALTVRDACAIRDCAVSCGVPVMVNHERRFADDYRLAKKCMDTIGDIQSVSAVLCSGMPVYSADREDSGAYSLIHDGTHLVDIVQYLLEPSGAGAAGDRLLRNPVITGVFYDGKGAVRNLSAHYETSRCPDVTVSVSGRSRFFSFELTVRGTTGMICIGNGYGMRLVRRESRLYTGFYSLEKDRKTRFPVRTGYFSHMIENAVAFLDGAASCGSPLDAAINDLAVLEEIKGCLRTR